MVKEQTPATGNLYARLGINRRATDDQVRTAYYRLAKVLHPDRRKGGEKDGETFNSIVQAAAILRDPARRRLYDRGAIDDDGELARSRTRRFRWSYRELALAWLTAAMTVAVSGVAFYSLSKSERALPPGGTPAAVVSHGASQAQPVAQSKEPLPAPRIYDSPAQLLKALRKQQAVYSPPPPAIAAPEEDAGDQAIQKSSINLNKPAAPKQKSKIAPYSANTIFSARPKKTSRTQSECSLTSAARNILAGIISR